MHFHKEKKRQLYTGLVTQQGNLLHSLETLRNPSEALCGSATGERTAAWEPLVVYAVLTGLYVVFE